MVTSLTIGGISCAVAPGATDRIAYILYPQIEPLSNSLLLRMASLHSTAVAAVYVPAAEWNNFLTPWPEPPESKGFPPFGGDAEKFRQLLVSEVAPGVEKALAMQPGCTRNLVGVSLSGLFALWTWLQHDTFHSISSLSGSFWYAGFMEWFSPLAIPPKTGSAYFLLGLDEPKARIAAYRSVGANTEAVVRRLEAAGVKTRMQWVPGNHFSEPVHRLELGFDNLDFH